MERKELFMGSAMVLHFYDDNSEVKETFTRCFVPWGMLKEAVKLQKAIDSEGMTEEILDQIAKVIVAVFGEKFSVEDLNKQVEISEMLAVLQQIVATARGVLPNPPPPG